MPLPENPVLQIGDESKHMLKHKSGEAQELEEAVQSKWAKMGL